MAFVFCNLLYLGIISRIGNASDCLIMLHEARPYRLILSKKVAL